MSTVILKGNVSQGDKSRWRSTGNGPRRGNGRWETERTVSMRLKYRLDTLSTATAFPWSWRRGGALPQHEEDRFGHVGVMVMS